MPQSRVRFIGSRELHRDLPKVLDSLENPDARYVLTIHSKPKAVLIGAEAFLNLLRGRSSDDRLLALQLGALVQGLESSIRFERRRREGRRARRSLIRATLRSPVRLDRVRLVRRFRSWKQRPRPWTGPIVRRTREVDPDRSPWPGPVEGR